MSDLFQRVDDSFESTPQDEYRSLLRSLRRRKGFGLVFVRCSPAGGVELIKKVYGDLPKKNISVLEIQEPVNNLIELVQAFPNQENLNILFIVGLEKSLEKYIRSGYGGEGDYYNLDDIPPILNHLNWQRENFRDRFRHLCLVFLLPQFAIKYIIRRAPDFYDWASGVFDYKVSITTPIEDLHDSEMPLIFLLFSAVGTSLLILGITKDLYIILGLVSGAIFIRALIFEINSGKRPSFLYLVAYIVFVSLIFSGKLPWYITLGLVSVTIVIKALSLRQNPRFSKATFTNLIIEVTKQFISIFRAQIPNSRGDQLSDLGRYEEAISSYDHALKINPESYLIWLKRGHILNKLGRYEEAISSYDHALKINPESYFAWSAKCYALVELGRYEESIECNNHVLQIYPNYHIGWKQQGYILNKLGRYEEAISSYDSALQINPNFYTGWNKRGITLCNLGRYKEAISSYNRAIKIESNYHEAYYNKACAYSLQNQIEPALENLQKAIKIKSEENREMAKIDSDFDNIRHDPRFQALIQ